MKVVKEGHVYELANIEEDTHQIVQFIHKDIDDDSTDRDTTNLKTITDGTSNEEVLKMMINRMNYLQRKMPCEENVSVIANLEKALESLTKRTQRRIDRGVEGTARN